MKFWKKYRKSVFILICALGIVSAAMMIPGTVAQPGNESSEPYSIKVAFDGKILSQDGSNVCISDWSGGKSKTAEIVVSRNTSVKVDSSKNYVVCMKVPDVLYFNGLPDVKDINGLEDVSIVKNAAPVVNTVNGGSESLSGFSPYSGEIRMVLNPSVETVTIPDIGISYNATLIGYSGGIQTIENPFQVDLVNVDSSESLDKFQDSDKTILKSAKVDSAEIKTVSLSGGGMRNSISIDGYTTAGVIEQNVNVGKADIVAFSGGTAGQNWQVYQTLEVVYHCPYITVDGKKYYLEFSQQDQALSANRQGSYKGYKLAKNVEYSAENHTLTYTFENIYLGGHTALFYTPVFSWPKDLASYEIPENTTCKIEGGNWEISNQTGYIGGNGTLRSSYTPNTVAYYIPDKINVAMVSSAEAPASKRMARREIYQGITRENGITGALGFFDIHNDGAKNSPLLDISFAFNTDESGNAKATYYAAQVNLPVYNNTTGTDVSYVLTNGTNEVKGMKHYSNTSSFSCQINDLRSNSGVNGSYYIKELSYQTALQKGTAYHIETAHLNRNRINDSGLFFGYLEGNLGEYAVATMSISAADGKTAITADGKTAITSTEKSNVSDQDYIGFSLREMTVDQKSSLSMTAGNSATLKFGASISAEEYPKSGTNVVNGYHVFRDGIFYICLPDGVSIPGTEQVEVTYNNQTISATEVKKMENSSCTVNSTAASWWMIKAPNINAQGNKGFNVSVQLASDEKMQGIVWDFQNCVAVRAEGQSISWGAAGSLNTVYDTVSSMDKSNMDSVKTLSSCLKANGESNDLGMCMYNGNTNTKMNIARAEAKLDVETTLTEEDSIEKGTSVRISDADETVNYNVTVSSNSGGYADNFEYYVPIVADSSTLDESALVAKNEIGMNLQGPVTVLQDDADTQHPFTIYYTTQEGLTSANIRNDSVEWTTTLDDYTKATAVKIITNPDAYINIGEAYGFQFHLKYDNRHSDFSQMAGCQAEWRSFGRYTYTRNGVSTTNTYPSGKNDVTAIYSNDMTDQTKQMVATLDTSAEKNSVDISRELGTSFKKNQTFKIKKVTASTGTQLISSSPSQLTGSAANNQFRVAFNINNIGADVLRESGVGGRWTVNAGTPVTLQANVSFSKALTDTTTPRYIDVTLGNDNVNVVCRIQLVRKVAAADAKESGLAPGENFLVPNVESSCTISRNSAVTGLYVIKNFVPGNFVSQKICWCDSSGTAKSFPDGTTLTMMRISEDNAVMDYWYYRADGSINSVDLNQFKRMSGTESFTYDTTATSGTTLRYLVVADFGNAEAAKGEYKMKFSAIDNDGKNTDFVTLPITLAEKTSYTFSLTKTEDLTMKASYDVTRWSTNDSYLEGKTLALVMRAESVIPQDAYLSDGSQNYYRNSSGNFIIPIGTIQEGSKILTLKSEMFPDKKTDYKLSGQLYVGNSNVSEAPMNGEKVDQERMVSLSKAETVKPAVKITGTRVGLASEWSAGQTLDFTVKNIPLNGSVTVTPYSGISGGQKVTDLLSSVSGVFDLKDGIGTYNTGKIKTGKLRLNSTASPGTYRLNFEVKDASGKTVLSAPYYVIVR